MTEPLEIPSLKPVDGPRHAREVGAMIKPDLLAQIDYADLIADLERYGGLSTAVAKAKHPKLDNGLIEAVIQASDECPFCLARFVRSPRISHNDGCPWAEEMVLRGG